MLIHVSLQLMHFPDFDLNFSEPSCKGCLPISLGFLMIVLLSCYLVVPGVVRKCVTSVERWVPTFDNQQQLPSSSTSLDINRRVREVHVSHSSPLWRSRVYHSRIKNEHSTQGERETSVILVALKHHNKETKKHRMRSYIFLKLKKPSFHSLYLERTSMRLIG